MCEIVMLIFGIITLVRGRFLLFRTKEVLGWPARIIGGFLILPLPLSFLAGMVLGAIFLSMGKDVDDKDFLLAAQIGEVAIVAICFFVALGIAMFYAEPIRKKKSEPEDAAVPDDYGERFDARARDVSHSEDITEGASRPAPPADDRIQG